MSGFERYARILDCFSEDRGSWTVAELSAALDTSASTLYRLVRELVAAGFLESAADARVRLGPAFVAYDRTLRLTDPLIHDGTGQLKPLVESADMPATAVLARLFGSTVMCVADAQTQAAPIASSFQRGRPMPLTRGATSLAILSAVEGRRLKRLIASEGLSEEGQRRLLATVSDCRRAGFVVTRGEVDKGAIGLAVPLASRRLGIEASLSLIVSSADCGDEREARLVGLLRDAAASITRKMETTAAPPADLS